MIKNSIVLFPLFFLYTLSVIAQKETNNWFFGKYAGINFSTNPPTILNGGAFNAREGVATISDPVTGQILFYTESTIVWNKNNVPMPNGTGLSGEEFAVIVPNPANKNKYYIFTTGIDRGFRFSEVDMLLDGGNGDVIQATKNTILIDPSISSEKVIAVRHCNGNDFWVITHTANDNHFYSFLITAAGIQLPVISAVGQLLRKVGGNFELCGYIKTSPNGKQLANAIGLEMDRARSQVEVFNYDNATGIITGPTFQLTGFSFPFGLEFSQNEQLLYVADLIAKEVSQYNLAAANVNASKVIIAKSPNLAYGAIQLTPYGNMYVAAENGYNVGYDYLGEIKFPDSLGLACRFNGQGLYLNGKQTLIGLPTFTASFLKDTSGFKHTFNCISKLSNFSIVYTGYISMVKWDFGDATPISNQLNPTHAYAAGGNYNVKLIVYRACNKNDTINRQISIPSLSPTQVNSSFCPGTTFRLPNGVNVSQPGTYTVTLNSTTGCDSTVVIQLSLASAPSFKLGNDTTICPNSYLFLDIGPGFASYLWQDGSTGSSYTARAPGLYWAEVHGVNGCFKRDSIIISNKTSPNFSLGPDTSICNSQNLTIGANVAQAVSYVWNTGANTPFISTNTQGLYWLEVKGINGCSFRDTLKVSTNPVSNVNLKDTGFCLGNTITLGASVSGATYLWNTGATTPYIVVSAPGSYWLEMNKFGCIKRNQANVNENNPPNVTIQKSNDIDCDKPVASLIAQGATNYTWTPAYGLSDPNSSNPFASIDSTTTYTVVGSAINGCSTSKSITVNVSKIGKNMAYSVANAFTPNGDGKNDCFRIKNWGILKSFELRIYNRWGQMVFITKDQNDCWNGTYKGTEQPPGEFIYLIKAKSVCGEISRKGVFFLLR